jgi:hypothetical protein
MTRCIGVWLLASAAALLTAGASLRGDDAAELKKLLQERLATARDGLKLAEEASSYKMLEELKSDLDLGIDALRRPEIRANYTTRNVREWSKRVLETELEVAEKKADRISAWEAYLERAKRFEKLAQKADRQGLGGLGEYPLAKYERLGAEVGLARAKQAP